MIKALIWISLIVHSLPAGTPVDIREYTGDGVSIIGYGTVSGASDGVLEAVAKNRMRGLASPELDPDTDLSAYDALIATERCAHVGSDGWMVVRNKDGDMARLRVLVVDCQAPRHRLNGGSLTELGLLADTSANAERYWHWRGFLVLEAQ